MELADITLALGGDKGNTVPKTGVTASEIAVLRAIHGDESVFDVEVVAPRNADEAERAAGTNRVEIERLRNIYGIARAHDGTNFVAALFPGAAARAFQTVEELELPEIFLKPVVVEAAPVEAAPVKKSTKKASAPVEAPVEAPAEPAPEDDGISDMPSVLE